jgi:hypothetical protein
LQQEAFRATLLLRRRQQQQLVLLQGLGLAAAQAAAAMMLSWAGWRPYWGSKGVQPTQLQQPQTQQTLLLLYLPCQLVMAKRTTQRQLRQLA